MHILVTRPEPEASELARRLNHLGHEATIAPMLRYESAAAGPIDLDGVQALIVTSRNGLRALSEHDHLVTVTGLPLFAVGPASAAGARELGFRSVIEAGGSARDLASLLAARLEPQDGDLLHAAGEDQAFDLKGTLEAMGFRVRQPVLYRMTPAPQPAPAVIEGLRAGAFSAVILMSPRTAGIFADLVVGSGLAEALRSTACLCLSEAVAAPLKRFPGVNVEIARKPNLEEMLALVTRLAAKLR